MNKIVYTLALLLSFNAGAMQKSSLSSLKAVTQLHPEEEEQITSIAPRVKLFIKNNELEPIYVVINERKLLNEISPANSREKIVKFKQLTNQLAILTIEIHRLDGDTFYLLDKIF